jgi:hypothetical protein
LIVASVVIPLAIITVLMAWGWRALRRRQLDVVGLAPVPAEGSVGAVTPLLTEDLLYVTTTRAEQPLQRIAVKGLGFPARAVVTVTAGGIRLDLAGNEPGFIPAEALNGVGRATWTIDRAVTTDGLVFVRWNDGAATVDSYLRSADPAALVAAIEALIPPTTPPTPPTTGATA